MDAEEIMKAAERISTLQRMYNIRMGAKENMMSERRAPSVTEIKGA